MKNWNLIDWIWYSWLWVTALVTPILSFGLLQDHYLGSSGCAFSLWLFSMFMLILIHIPGKTYE